MKRELTALEKFLTADYDAQFELASDPATKAQIKAWMGADEFRQWEASGPGPGHLAAGPKNIVFAPGVMGSTLQSNGLGGVWWLDLARARDKLDQLKLNSDGTADADADAEIAPGAVDVAYSPFCRAIAKSGAFGGSVHFPFDWRKSMRASADALRTTILKVFDDYGKPVHLVGHSMGGLMLRVALMIYGKELWPKIGKVVFIGTPHHGSTSIAGYLKNHLWGWEDIAVLGMYLTRETFRTMRGVLSLLPAPAGVYPGSRPGEHPCANFDLYDANAWCLNLDAAAMVHLQNVLDEVKKFYTDLHQWHGSLLQEYKDRMLMIAGVGQETLFRLQFDKAFWGLWKNTKKFTERIACDPNREGDGRVPMASAQLEDIATRYVKGEHGGLPNIPAVAHDVLAWLTAKELKLATTCQGALSGHLSAEDETPTAPLLDGTGIGSLYRELPEYENPTPTFRAKIENELNAGKMPRINLIKIL